MAIEGGCLCGAVRFTIDAEPLGARACWCRACQYWASVNAANNVIFPAAALSVTGETTDYVSTADSGNVMHRRFCPICGTQLFSAAEIRPQVVIVRLGALDDPDLGAPKGIIWAGSAPKWACLDPDLPRIAGQPPAPPPT